MNDTSSADALVVFAPSGKRGRFPVGTPVLTAARRLGVDIDSVCGGRAICGRCQVTVSEGQFAKFQVTSRSTHLTGIGAEERQYAEKKSIAEGRRLACCAKLLGDCVIDVPPDSQVHRQIVRKRAEARRILVDPVVTLHYVEVAEPDMHDPSGDLRRVEQALETQWDLRGLDCDLHVLHGLQKALRQGKWKITVAVRGAAPGALGGTIVAVWPEFHDPLSGLAVDIGSTTIAAHLCDLHTGNVVAASGVMNPQIRFGEDLMSRVSYVMMNPGGEAEMTQVVRAAIDSLAGEVARAAGIAATDIVEATVVGNPIMHHLFLGLDPTELGGAPFALAVDRAVTMRAGELGLNLHPGARVYVLPCIAGHVGADTAGVILSESPQTSDELMLVVDVGTNAEIVLGNRHRLLAASSPTGPAFEGAQVSSGQRAAPGAIERLRIDRATLEPRYKVIGCDLWSDEPGFAEATAAAGVTGICGSGIIEAIAEMYLSGILTHDGVIDGSAAARTPRVQSDGRTFSYLIREGEPAIRITQNDVRAIQLAKAALYAGARLLMDRYGVEQVDRIVLAGAFGSHIDTDYAMVLGMIPDCPLSKVSAAGNAAGTGARIALVNRSARAEIEAVVRRVEKIETAVEPRFQEHFVDAMAIPHKKAAYPNLAAAVKLPEPKRAATADAPGEERRRRRRQ
jgi:uncharacterized 2Fe-2S/4Fe-4S cluster protein (DUF4445 family)